MPIDSKPKTSRTPNWSDHPGCTHDHPFISSSKPEPTQYIDAKTTILHTNVVNSWTRFQIISDPLRLLCKPSPNLIFLSLHPMHTLQLSLHRHFCAHLR
ncbi:hypothetical protein M758_3G009100 [Ceratodon purpureus]|nr:hypothetical protein M758_3G009100 [Ceratodon purpureus]